MSEMATKIFEQSIGKTVLVELKGGRGVRGRLYSYDQHMNLVLEDAEEIGEENSTRRIGTIIVRGDNVIIISPSPNKSTPP